MLFISAWKKIFLYYQIVFFSFLYGLKFSASVILVNSASTKLNRAGNEVRVTAMKNYHFYIRVLDIRNVFRAAVVAQW